MRPHEQVVMILRDAKQTKRRHVRSPLGVPVLQLSPHFPTTRIPPGLHNARELRPWDLVTTSPHLPNHEENHVPRIARWLFVREDLTLDPRGQGFHELLGCEPE